jgi:preprotein translocase subunit SecG
VLKQKDKISRAFEEGMMIVVCVCVCVCVCVWVGLYFSERGAGAFVFGLSIVVTLSNKMGGFLTRFTLQLFVVVCCGGRLEGG